MAVYTSVIAQSAISSASSRTRCIDAIVASMLTTTPFLSPRDGCAPRPMMLSRLSDVTSATLATIFDVPMSRPTIRFLLSFTMCALLPRFARRPFREPRHAHCKAVAIAQVDVVDARAAAIKRADGARVIADEARQPVARRAAPELDRKRSAAPRPQLPAAARRQPQLGNRERARLEGNAEFAVAPGNLRRTAVRTDELRQLAVEVGAEDLALGIDQPGVVPARQRLVLGDRDLEPVGPLPAQRDALDPGHTLQRRACFGEAQCEECAIELLADHCLEVGAARACEVAVDDDAVERECALMHRPRDRSPGEHRGRHKREQ